MKYYAFLPALILLLIASCGRSSVNTKIHNDFEARRDSLGYTGLYDIFDRDLTEAEREYMEFLYAYMPLPDITNYSDSFYLENVRMSLKAREEMPWGKTVPEREFRHFVLPVRVNNENLDSARMVFYSELKDRVKGMSMSDAILEINHWCHEKVTYRPSDARTSSPLASVRTAYGRCGEESTFTVAAMRAMGIPARQVYTPRWAHTDDNHAWVEAWADGQWHFLGACEPEAILDLGWFNAPASRGMMMNTKVMGAYDGPEEVLATSPCYTEINVTANYAPVATATVKVTGPAGNPVTGARVEFKLYNYAEFFPIGRKVTGNDGIATLTTGLGDMLVWASHEGKFGFNRLSVNKDGGEATVVLDLDGKSTDAWEWDMVPPRPGSDIPTPTTEQAQVNSCRLAQEDSIRNAYTATFVNIDGGCRIAAELGFSGADVNRVAALLVASEGNHEVIEMFLKKYGNDQRALPLLEAISEKDLRDITPDVLADRMTVPMVDNVLFNKYILSPRVGNEMLSPYNEAISSAFDAECRESFRRNPASLVAWINDSIDIDSNWNPQYLNMLPVAVLDYRHTDERSRNTFFVAMARTFGIPARIDAITGKTQYADSLGRWIDINPADETVTFAPTGMLSLEFVPDGYLTDPLYYYHFTLSKIVEGVPVLLNYPDDTPWATNFAKPVTLDCGQYLLTTGQRLADGTVLSRIEIFEITEGETTTVPLTVRQDDSRVQVLGSFNSENPYNDIASNSVKSILSTTGRGYYILGILAPNHEPTVHALNDLVQYSEKLQDSGHKILLLAQTPEELTRLDLSRFQGLPSNVVVGTDVDGNITAELVENLKLTPGQYPIFIIADTFNRVVYVTQGYNIGLGKQIVDTLNKID